MSDIFNRSIIFDKIMYYFYRTYFYENVIKNLSNNLTLNMTWLEIEGSDKKQHYYVENINRLLPLLFIYPGDYNKNIPDDRKITRMIRSGSRNYSEWNIDITKNIDYRLYIIDEDQ